MGIFGLATGFVYLAILRNVWNYFPANKGIAGGMVLSAYGLSSVIFTSIADALINPNGVVADKEGIFPKTVAENIKIFIYVELIIFSIGGVLGVCLTFPYTIDENQKSESDEKYIKLNEEVKFK